MKKTLTKEEILHLAALSKLILNDSEITELQNKLSETISFIENLQEIDTTQVIIEAEANTNVFHEDKIDNKRQFSKDEALFNASKKKDGFFVVDRIL